MSYITGIAVKQMTEAFSERLEDTGVTRIQWIAMFYLNQYGELNQRELGVHMNIKDSTVVRLIDRMERDGLIGRVRSSFDRRVSNLTLTEKGKSLWIELEPIGDAFLTQLGNGISKEEMEIFQQVLSRMVDNVTSK